MSLSTGTVLENRYRIDALLGEGGMGAVYRASDQRLRQFVAIKENRMASPASARQFESEALMMARLRHPNLPRVGDHFITPDGAQYLVMDYIEGEDLGQILERTGALDEARALAWIDQVCDALVYLHSQNPPIIHRDIKPGNIKITPQGQVFLVDFGIAKIGEARERTRTGALGVTTGYSPPEQHGSGGTDARSDVYALGATLYTLLTGRVPPDSVQRSIKAEILTPPRQLRPDLNPSLASAISAALNTTPTDRPQTIAAFRALLRPGAGTRPPGPSPFGRPVPVWAWVVGAAAVLLLCGLTAAALGAALPSLLGTQTQTPVRTEAPLTPVPTEARTTDAATEPPSQESSPSTESTVVLTVSGLGEYECTDEWGCATFEKGDNVKVGYVGPTTGDYSAYGIDMSRGAELAIKANPAIKGFTVELLIEDTQGSPEQGAAVANKFAADPQLVAVDGHAFSGSTEVAIPIYRDAGIVMLSPSATNIALTTLGSEVFNRVAFHDGMQGEFAAKYIFAQLGVKSIAVMHYGRTYGQGLSVLTAAALEALGGTVVGSEAITPGETDYSAPLAAIAELEPELIYWGGNGSDAAVLVTQMAAAGLEDAMFFGCDGTFGANYIDLAGDAAEGTFSTNVPIPETEEFLQFQAEYQADYGEEQGKLSRFSPHAHDAMAVLLAAIDKVAVEHGDSLIIPRKALANEVRGTQDFAGLTGRITCDDTGECAAAAIKFMLVEGGEWVEAPGQ